MKAGKSTNLVNAGVQTEHSSVSDLGVQVSQLAVDELDSDLRALSIAFSKYCMMNLKLEVCEDFLEVSASAMVKLKAGNKSNVVNNLSKGVGTNRSDESESRFPVARMPMGLVEYTTNFFVADDLNSVCFLTRVRKRAGYSNRVCPYIYIYIYTIVTMEIAM